MVYLQDKVAESVIPTQKAIHDCVDTGNDFALLTDTEVLFPCDCAVRDYSNNGNKWDKTTFLLLYNGTDSEATQYGFEVRIVADGGVVLKDRSILIVT